MRTREWVWLKPTTDSLMNKIKWRRENKTKRNSKSKKQKEEKKKIKEEGDKETNNDFLSPSLIMNEYETIFWKENKLNINAHREKCVDFSLMFNKLFTGFFLNMKENIWLVFLAISMMIIIIILKRGGEVYMLWGFCFCCLCNAHCTNLWTSLSVFQTTPAMSTTQSPDTNTNTNNPFSLCFKDKEETPPPSSSSSNEEERTNARKKGEFCTYCKDTKSTEMQVKGRKEGKAFWHNCLKTWTSE